MTEKSVRREENWNSEWAEMQKRHVQELKTKADELAHLDKWYRDELAAEKERNRQEVSEIRALHF